MEESWYLPLTQSESARLYWELSKRGAYCVGEKQHWSYAQLGEEELLALAVLQSRYDPRLLAVLVDYLREPRSLDPVLFKKRLREREALTLSAVIGEFVLESAPSEGVRDLFHFLRAGVRPVPTQLYYKGLYRIGGTKMEEALTRPLWAFKKWGYLAADSPYLRDRSPARRVYLFDENSRRQVLKDLADRQPRFLLRDYLDAIGGSISRQQALKDLQSTPWIRKRGRGKGTYYKILLK